MAEYRASTLPAYAVALLLLAAVMQEGGPPAPQLVAAEGLAGPVAAIVARVIDGDTIEVKAAIWLGQTLVVRVRIDGVDAPELEARCPEERKLALAARDFLAGRLEGAAVKLVVYQSAYAGFDLLNLTTPIQYLGHRLQFNETATKQSSEALREFLNSMVIARL